jgi:MoaA/NifB/PqqE/SkfB family radical SAM enzyme
MTSVKNIRGTAKRIFNLRVKLTVFLHFLPELLRGRLPLRRRLAFARRLLFFLGRLQHNKFARIGAHTRFDLYVPGFPSEAFYTACRKFLTFGEKLPCTTVLVSITSACRFRCPHCYQQKDKGHDVDIERLLPVVRQMQDMGVSFFNIEGGDPFLVYDRLRRVCETIDSRSEIWVNSTGDGMTRERLEELKELGLTAVMFSLHTPEPAELCAFMGSDRAWDTLVRGVQTCHGADVPVCFNMCIQRQGFHDGTFERLMDRAKELHAAMVQVIKPKAAGGWLEKGPEEFTADDLGRAKELVNRYNHAVQFAEYPAISAQVMEEDPTMFGCTAGGTDRFYINAKGDVQPCEFLNLSFGNIACEDFAVIYRRMRSQFEGPGECWLCERYAPAIRRILERESLQVLPLDPDLSKEVYEGWDRGAPTELYDTMENRIV